MCGAEVQTAVVGPVISGTPILPALPTELPVTVVGVAALLPFVTAVSEGIVGVSESEGNLKLSVSSLMSPYL